MISISFVLFLLAHVIGDYYIQIGSYGKKENSVINRIIFYFLYTGITSIILIFFYMELYMYFLICAGIFISHIVLDLARGKLIKVVTKKRFMVLIPYVYQFLHIGVLFSFSLLMVQFNFIGYNVFEGFYIYYLHFNIPPVTFLIYILSVSFLIYPSVILIRNTMNVIFQKDKNNNDVDNAGAIIGVLERLIIYLCIVSFNWYEIILVVLTAKTIVRFKRFENPFSSDCDKNNDRFAEKFLIGTLLSIIFALGFVGLTKYVQWRGY